MQSLFSPEVRNGYVADILRNYGDRGRPIPLPKVDQDVYARGMQFREQEKKHFANLDQRLKETERRLYKERQRNMKLNKFIQSIEFLDDNDSTVNATIGSGDSSSHAGGDGGGGLLPPESDARQNDTDSRQPEAIISSIETVTDEPPDARGGRSRSHDAKPKPEGEVRGDSEVADPGGSPHGPTDGSEPNARGSATEDRAQE